MCRELLIANIGGNNCAEIISSCYEAENGDHCCNKLLFDRPIHIYTISKGNYDHVSTVEVMGHDASLGLGSFH